MDLKAFIKETITSIAQAAVELQAELEGHDVIINPPRDPKTPDVFDAGHFASRYRHIETISFDVALTTSEEGGEKGGGEIKVAFMGIGAKAGGTLTEKTAAENVSRVAFSIGIALPPSKLEKENQSKAAAIKTRPSR